MLQTEKGLQAVRVSGLAVNPLYRWGDGLWIGRDIEGEDKRPSFVLSSSTNEMLSILNVREGGDQPFPVYISGRSHLSKKPESEKVKERVLSIQKRWYPFLKHCLWSLQLADFNRQEFPVFVPDDVFERASKMMGSDLEIARKLVHRKLRNKTGSQSLYDRAGLNVIEHIFAVQGTIPSSFEYSVEIQGITLLFWTNHKNTWTGARISSKSSGEVQYRAHRAESIGQLITKMAKARVLLPASEEATWGPPGQLTIDVDFSMYQMLGLTSPLLESNAVYAEWIQALDTVTG